MDPMTTEGKEEDGEAVDARKEESAAPAADESNGKTDKADDGKEEMKEKSKDGKKELQKEEEKKDENKSDKTAKETEDQDKEPGKETKDGEATNFVKKQGKEILPEDKKRKAEDDTPTESKRKRKTAAAYKPEDFSQPKHQVQVMSGRGDKLCDLPSVRESIESYSVNDDVFAMAYRFIFVTRGRLPKNEAKQQMLDFSGYLPPLDEKEDKAKVEQRDEELETKYSKRAYKLTVPQIRALCDFFDVDRSPGPEEKVDKDVMIERLLDFLSAPDEHYTSAYAKKHKKATLAKQRKKETKKGSGSDSSKKRKADEAEEEPSENSDEPLGKVEEGVLPTDDQLRKWVRAYVTCHNMNKVTLKHALEVASSKFGVDMEAKKKTIKLMLTEEC